LTFLHNHRQAIAAFDFFTVPTLGFHTFCCFFVIEHRRRRILAFNSAAHPSAVWIVQQLRFAFSNPYPYRDVVFDCAFRSSRSAFRDDGGRYRSEATLAFFMVGK
jgi:hypothetical protein